MEIHLQVHLKCQSSIEVLFSMLFTWDFLHLIIYTLLEFSSFWFSNFGSKLKEKTLLKWEENNVENLMNKLDFPINANFYETTNESFFSELFMMFICKLQLLCMHVLQLFPAHTPQVCCYTNMGYYMGSTVCNEGRFAKKIFMFL